LIIEMGPNSAFSVGRDWSFNALSVGRPYLSWQSFVMSVAKGVLGQIYLDLGLLHMAKNKRDEARVCLSEAVGLFEQCEAKVYLKQAQEVLERLG
jgi:hypothetical protein